MNGGEGTGGLTFISDWLTGCEWGLIKLPVDYHIHTKMCGHAFGEMEEYIAVARSKGLKEIGFSDHLPLYFLSPEQRPEGYAMTPEMLPDYVASVERLREETGNVRVKLGVEGDFVPGFTQQLGDLLNSQSFDYVLGSVHFVDGWSFDNEEEIEQYNKWNILDLYENYFTTLQKAAESGFFDIMAHPDLIKKFGYVPESSLIPLYEDTVRVFKKA
ncbi:MAG: histidinol-phosphatase HisJ family protein, partial [Peptococcaceae bacterium]|nr:histidinol-phosphatase HisJ family protein [Peptococcaceae bacterium]